MDAAPINLWRILIKQISKLHFVTIKFGSFVTFHWFVHGHSGAHVCHVTGTHVHTCDTLRIFRCTRVPCYGYWGAHVCHVTGIQVHTCAMLRLLRCTRVPCYGYSGAHVCHVTGIQVHTCAMLRFSVILLETDFQNFISIVHAWYAWEITSVHPTFYLY